jgi:hypothetical protein
VTNGGTVGRQPGFDEWPYTRILVDIASSILKSADIQQALAQAETTADTLRELITAQAENFILMTPSGNAEFVQKLNLIKLKSSRFAYVSVGALALAILIVVTINAFFPMAMVPKIAISIAVLYMVGLFIFFLFVGNVHSFYSPLEPTTDTKEELAEKVVGPFVREEINRIIDNGQHSSVMHVMSAPGLSEITSRQRLIPTQSLQAIWRLSRDMSSGSIGVSGPRGVGKTTLLRYFCDPSFESATGSDQGIFAADDVRCMVSAPVNYDARDFTLHVFSKLCTEVIGSGAARHMRPRRFGPSKQIRTFGPLAMVAALAIAVSSVPVRDWPRALGSLSAWTTGVALLGGIVLVVSLADWWSLRKTGRPQEEQQKLLDEARHWQESIRYAHTFTAGSSGSLGLPRALQVGISRSHQVQEIPITLPELVEAMRDFATRVIRERQKFSSWYAEISKRSPLSSGYPEIHDLKPRIVIGVDEIDKMDSESAKRFLNDIKAIFGMPDCLYLVSVSDEALDIYEQRVLFGRTAFDSAFDEIARVQPLDFESCTRLLRRRIAGIPESVIAFCQVMSGGVPRDIIRAARSVLDARIRGHEKVRDIVLDLVIAEIQILKRTCISEIARLEGGLARLPSAVLRPDWPGRTAEDIATSIGDYSEDEELPFKFHVGLYFYSTVTDVFSTKLAETIKLLRSYQPEGESGIDQLVQARNAISINPAVAWQMISDFRSTRGLRAIKEPVPTPDRRLQNVHSAGTDYERRRGL